MKLNFMGLFTIEGTPEDFSRFVAGLMVMAKKYADSQQEKAVNDCLQGIFDKLKNPKPDQQNNAESP